MFMAPIKAHKKLTSGGHGIGASFASTKLEVLRGSVIQEYNEIANRNLVLQARPWEWTTRYIPYTIKSYTQLIRLLLHWIN